MGMTDGYKNESGFGPGMKELTVLSVKFVQAKNTGTDGFEITYCVGNSLDHPVRKTLWQSKLFNRFITSWLVGLELNPLDLEKAVKDGRGDQFLLERFPGRHGIFMFAETENINEKTGRPYLEPKSKAEVDFDEWIKEQNGGAKPNQGMSDLPMGNQFSGNEPPVDSYQGMATSKPEQSDDIPW